MIRTMGSAYAQYNNGILETGTGKVTRRWEWSGGGFSTVDIKDELTGAVYAGEGLCDFDIFGVSAGSSCELHSVSIYEADDAVSSQRLETVAVIFYPVLRIIIKFVIWTYPEASGIRTQLFLKAMHGYEPVNEYGESVADSIPYSGSTVRAIGYYNDTQHRNTFETEILEEKDYAALSGLRIDWANAVAVPGAGGGVCVFKESNKCVNQPAYETGGFEFGKRIIKVTGIGLQPKDLSTGRYLFAFATWMILYDGTGDGLERSVKSFDRTRFPLHGPRDMYIMSNTWGNTGNGAPSCDSARSGAVLKELPIAAEIGVDVLQVDSGWHSPLGTDYFAEDLPWYTDPGKYPYGWGMIAEPARKLGLDLGVWFSYWATADEIIDNMRQGGFKYYKIDFADLATREALDTLIDKAGRLYTAGGGDVRINWDVTENPARMGYYFGREFGNIYLANRKPAFPRNAIYIPYLVLRDVWQLAKYASINQFQTTCQNLDLIDRELSDAYLHSFPYCAMIAFMGSPIFFQLLHLLSDKAKRELKEIIAVYKTRREAMYESIVYPIGSKPDNHSWAGFQFDGGGHGQIVLFREVGNCSENEKIKLKFIKDKVIAATDAMTGSKCDVDVDKDGCAEFNIPEPCSFAWYYYDI